MAAAGTLTRGDYERIDFAVALSGEPVDLTGHTLRFSAKRIVSEDEPLVSKSSANAGEIVLTDVAGGEGYVVIEPEDLAEIVRGTKLYCDLEVTDAAGRPSTTLFEVEVVPDITTQ